MFWSAPVVEIWCKRFFWVLCFFFFFFAFFSMKTKPNIIISPHLESQKKGLQLLYCGKIHPKRKVHTLKGQLLKKTSHDHSIYAYALFVQSFYSFYSHFLLPLFTSLYNGFTSLCSSHLFFGLNTKLYFFPPQSSLHFVSDTEVSLDYIFSTLFLLITTCM